jgi:hypothetical protein
MQSDLQATKSQLMNFSEPEIMKTDSFTARVWTIVLSRFELWVNVWRIVIARGK